MSAAFSRCLWGRNEWVTNEPQRTSNLEPLCQQYTCVWPHRVRKWCFQACSVLGILNKGIVLNNSNNGNVMASRSVHGYHAHFRIQDREKGKWNNGILVVFFGICFWKVLSVIGIKGGWTRAAGNLRLISIKKKIMLLDNVCTEQNQIQIQTYPTQSSVNTWYIRVLK